MPSKRPSAHPSKPKKHPLPADDPPTNPNPKDSKIPKDPSAPATASPRKRKAESIPSAAAVESAAASPRKRKAESVPSAAAVESAAVSPRKRKAESVPSASVESAPAFHSRFTCDDDDTILNAIVQFRLRTGATPTRSTLTAFYDSIRDSLPPDITTAVQVYNRIRTLRAKYRRAAASGPHDTSFYKLASEVWGVPVEGEEENGALESGDVSGSCAIMKGNLIQYWGKKGLSEELLDAGLRLVDPAKVRAMEGKWWRQYATNMNLQGKRCELDKDLFMLLGATGK